MGYFKYIWYEERAEFEGDEDERKINQSLMRGGDKYVVFYTWNPPKSLNSWVNQDVLQEREDTLCSHSTYLTVPRDVAWRAVLHRGRGAEEKEEACIPA